MQTLLGEEEEKPGHYRYTDKCRQKEQDLENAICRQDPDLNMHFLIPVTHISGANSILGVYTDFSQI